MKSIEAMMPYEEYLRTYFSIKLGTLMRTYNLRCPNEEQRNLQLAEEALNLVAYVECADNKGHVDSLFQHYGNFCLISGDYIFLILPYVDDGKIITAFPESKKVDVLDADTIAKEVKTFRDKYFENKKVIVYKVLFYSTEDNPGHTGEFINDYGRFVYDICLDTNLSDEETEDATYVQYNQFN